MKYRVILQIEQAQKSEDDPEVEKLVEAANEDDAREKAKELVRIENPELNHLKTYFWVIYPVF